MRWIELALFCAVVSITCAEPDPKKYKTEIKTKEKQSSTSLLTNDEKKFLREVEAKFGIKSDIPVEDTENEDDEEEDLKPSEGAPIKPPFPAVIAIEIVNDTDTKSKGKRTIDANLGYGYRTNNGYSYTYLGKPEQDKGKFMIYPYSQDDIPPAKPTHSNSGYSPAGQKYPKNSVQVEITPSQAYELVPAKEEQTSYQYEKPAVEFKTNYENIQSVESPPPPQHTPSTLYTTYNGHQFSGLSGQFPSVMSNYLVDPTQLLKNPQYQSAGLTQDHLRSHGGQLEQRVVPVLVLRIPSSYLKEPKAELYANVPQNYPLSQYLNNVNLQELVNQYFKKIGYQYAPQVMAYQSPRLQPAPVESSVATPVSNHVPQQYASPYVQPTYTHADYSGVQYSAVQPVMARYPSGYHRQQYLVARGQSLYRQPLQQQQYVYRYSYVPQSAVPTQSYYVQPQYQQQAYQVAVQEGQNDHAVVEQPSGVHDSSGHAEYGAPQQSNQDEDEVTHVQYTIGHTPVPEYEQAHSVTPQYETVETATAQYEQPKEEALVDHGPTKVPLSVYGSHASQVHQPIVHQHFQQPVQKETVAVFPRSQTGHRYGIHAPAPAQQTYVYQKQVHGGSPGDSLALSENYPSKDHTIATVLPLSYKNRIPHHEPVQAVSYVTPLPHIMKYHSQYRVMVPQTYLRNPSPTSEKVAYVNSHSLPLSHNSHLGSTNSREVEYTVGPHYVPPFGKQRPPQHPRNYHAHPKRMTRQESKSDTAVSKKQHERSEKRKLS